MSPLLRNIIAVISGAVVGSVVNMGIISLSGSIIPPPEGADVTSMEGLKASMHLFEPKHFLMPFLAHALGTLAGAFVAALIAASNKMLFALALGGLFSLGGIINVYLLPAPVWFVVLDLAGAYLPMGYLGGKFVMKSGRNKESAP